MNNSKIYRKLKKQGMTDEEIAESMIFPSEETPEEREEFKRVLKEYRDQMTPEIKQKLKDLQQKFIDENNNEKK